MVKRHCCLLFIAIFLLKASASFAENRQTPTPYAGDGSSKSPSSLTIFFSEGSSKLRPADKSTLDRASRVYNEGKPIVMIITGGADRTGSGIANLRLSQDRANTVLHALIDRGIPADRFQVLAKGETELPVPTRPGVADRENRRVVISWH